MLIVFFSCLQSVWFGAKSSWANQGHGAPPWSPGFPSSDVVWERDRTRSHPRPPPVVSAMASTLPLPPARTPAPAAQANGAAYSALRHSASTARGTATRPSSAWTIAARGLKSSFERVASQRHGIRSDSADTRRKSPDLRQKTLRKHRPTAVCSLTASAHGRTREMIQGSSMTRAARGLLSIRRCCPSPSQLTNGFPRTRPMS